MKKLLLIVCGFILVVGFQNCSPVQYSELNDGLAKSSGDDLLANANERVPGTDLLSGDDTGRDPVHDPRPPDRNPGADNRTPVKADLPTVTTGNSPQDCDYCKHLDMDSAIVAGSMDYAYPSRKGHLVLESARDVSIGSINGSVRISNAASLSILGGRGSVQARALTVSSIQVISGSVCLVAEKVGTIQTITGTLKVAAKEIDLISNVSGMVKIYGATVKELSTVKNVCLYEGAQVLNANGANVRRCD